MSTVSPLSFPCRRMWSAVLRGWRVFLPCVVLMVLAGVALADETKGKADDKSVDLAKIVAQVEREHPFPDGRLGGFKEQFRELNLATLERLLTETGSIKHPWSRLPANLALAGRLAAHKPAAAIKAALRTMRTEDGPPNDLMREWVEIIRTSARQWGLEDAQAALQWCDMADEIGGFAFGRDGDMGPTIRGEIVAAALSTNEAAALKQLAKLGPEAAALALSTYAYSVKEPAAFFYREVARLPAENRTAPLCAAAASLAGAGKRDAVVALMKNNAPDDVSRGAIALAAVSRGNPPLDTAMKDDLPWLLEHVPASRRGATLGKFFGGHAFFRFDPAIEALHKTVAAADLDAALAAFLAGNSFKEPAKAFAESQKIKDAQVRLDTMSEIFRTWSFFRKQEAARSLLDAKAKLSDAEFKALERIVLDR